MKLRFVERIIPDGDDGSGNLVGRKVRILQVQYEDMPWVDVPLEKEAGHMTASEVSRQYEEVNKALGHQYAQLQEELLMPMVERALQNVLAEKCSQYDLNAMVEVLDQYAKIKFLYDRTHHAITPQILDVAITGVLMLLKRVQND